MLFFLIGWEKEVTTDDVGCFVCWRPWQGGANGDAEPIACPAPSTPDPTYAKPNKVQRAGTKDQLDSLLGNLQVRFFFRLLLLLLLLLMVV